MFEVDVSRVLDNTSIPIALRIALIVLVTTTGAVTIPASIGVCCAQRRRCVERHRNFGAIMLYACVAIAFFAWCLAHEVGAKVQWCNRSLGIHFGMWSMTHGVVAWRTLDLAFGLAHTDFQLRVAQPHRNASQPNRRSSPDATSSSSHDATHQESFARLHVSCLVRGVRYRNTTRLAASFFAAGSAFYISALYLSRACTLDDYASLQSAAWILFAVTLAFALMVSPHVCKARVDALPQRLELSCALACVIFTLTIRNVVYYALQMHRLTSIERAVDESNAKRLSTTLLVFIHVDRFLVAFETSAVLMLFLLMPLWYARRHRLRRARSQVSRYESSSIPIHTDVNKDAATLLSRASSGATRDTTTPATSTVLFVRSDLSMVATSPFTSTVSSPKQIESDVKSAAKSATKHPAEGKHDYTLKKRNTLHVNAHTFDLLALIAQPRGRASFLRHLITEQNVENLVFLEAVDRYRTSSLLAATSEHEMQAGAVHIYHAHVSRMGLSQVNLPSMRVREIQQRLGPLILNANGQRPSMLPTTAETAATPHTTTPATAPAKMATAGPPLFSIPSPRQRRLEQATLLASLVKESPAAAQATLERKILTGSSPDLPLLRQPPVSIANSSPFHLARLAAGAVAGIVTPFMYDASQIEILSLLRRDVLPRYLDSALYEQYRVDNENAVSI